MTNRLDHQRPVAQRSGRRRWPWALGVIVILGVLFFKTTLSVLGIVAFAIVVLIALKVVSASVHSNNPAYWAEKNYHQAKRQRAQIRRQLRRRR